MIRFQLRRVLTVALLLGAGTAGLAVAQPGSVHAAGPSIAPTTFDSAHPTVSGILVAHPQGGEGNLPTACRDKSGASMTSSTLHRGLVICTEEGKLVVLDISQSTGIFARYWGRIGLGRLANGDRINAWGVLHDNGFLLRPTYAVQDTDVQEAYVDSQDFITEGGHRLTLGVLSSDSNGPVQGIVYAYKGGPTHVTRCNGHSGNWADLTAGKTINISESLFNRRLNAYIYTGVVKIVSCP